MAPMYGKSSKLVRLIPTMEQQRQIGETYTTKWDTESGYPTRLYIKEARQCNDTRPPLDRIKLIQGNHLQQRRIYAFYIEFCGDPTRWHIEERQCSCSFLYGWETANRICGSVGFRGCIGYMKTLVTLHLLNLYGWETAWVFQFLRVFAAVLALRLVSEYWRYFSGYIHIR
jgi:hypothetical protein